MDRVESRTEGEILLGSLTRFEFIWTLAIVLKVFESSCVVSICAKKRHEHDPMTHVS